jgi:hypothetical protein
MIKHFKTRHIPYKLPNLGHCVVAIGFAAYPKKSRLIQFRNSRSIHGVQTIERFLRLQLAAERNILPS